MFANGAVVLQLSYALLVGGAIASERRLTRVLIGLSGALALVHALLWTHDMVAGLWMGALFTACALVLLRDLLANRGVRFTAEEEAMRSRVLAALPRAAARHLIDQGVWLSGAAGDMLTEEAWPVDHIVYLAEGSAEVLLEGHRIARLHAGDLIGEVTILTGEAATATVVLASAARFWCAPAGRLRAYLAANPKVRLALERSFSEALKAKLVASNRTLAQVG